MEYFQRDSIGPGFSTNKYELRLMIKIHKIVFTLSYFSFKVLIDNKLSNHTLRTIKPTKYGSWKFSASRPAQFRTCGSLRHGAPMVLPWFSHGAPMVLGSASRPGQSQTSGSLHHGAPRAAPGCRPPSRRALGLHPQCPARGHGSRS